MTEQHRALPEVWAAAEKWGANEMDGINCVLELRARIEALEAGATCPHVRSSDEGTSYCALAESVAAQQPPLFTAEEVARIVAPRSPAGSLVERVQQSINDHPFGEEARAAILEVAAWMVEQAPEPGPVGKWLGQISTPFAVMADMLRDEANR
jgi:hypothetical protein